MKEIPLTQGKVALVDDEDYEALARRKWCAARIQGIWYAVARRADGGEEHRLLYMHREIMGADPGKKIDHRDGDGLNNRRCNLRYCTDAENARNQRRRSRASRCLSQYKGVRWVGPDKWTASIVVNYKYSYLGVFGSEADAARAYNAAAIQHFGEFACLNVIEE